MTVLVRMSKEEAEMVKNQADKLGLSVSSYIRMLVHKEEQK
jgi:predicted DNA binding CopG/RHH family protein